MACVAYERTWNGDDQLSLLFEAQPNHRIDRQLPAAQVTGAD